MGIDRFAVQMASALNDQELIERDRVWSERMAEAKRTGNVIGQAMIKRPYEAFQAEMRRRGLTKEEPTCR